MKAAATSPADAVAKNKKQRAPFELFTQEALLIVTPHTQNMIKSLITFLLIQALLTPCVLTCLEPSEEKVIEANFKKPINQLTITPLSGGFSIASLYKIQDANHIYVGRFTNEPNKKRTYRTFYAMQEAAKVGISPKIHSTHHETGTIFMDFIHTPKTTITDAKKPENCVKIALALQKAHATPQNPISRSSTPLRAERRYQKMLVQGISHELCHEAIRLLEKYHETLVQLPAPKVNTHGDLNPRNIFFTSENALLLDWEETNYEDPLYDLTYFALAHNYTYDEEMFLLKTYFGRIPHDNELQRFDLIKKITLASTITKLEALAEQLLEMQSQKLNPENPIHDCSDYTQRFSEFDEEITAQFFHDWARALFVELKKPNP